MCFLGSGPDLDGFLEKSVENNQISMCKREKLQGTEIQDCAFKISYVYNNGNYATSFIFSKSKRERQQIQVLNHILRIFNFGFWRFLNLFLLWPYFINFTILQILIELHWLPVEKRIVFKTAVYVFKSLHGQSPSYVKDMTLWHSRPRNLRQHRAPTLQTPLLRKAVGRQSFSYSSAYVWNSLPLDIRNQQTLESFKRSLKTHLFLEAYSPWQDVFTMYFNLFVYNVFI